MMRLWGRQNSINVQKILWCLLELGLHEGKDFERIDAGLQFGKNHTPEFLKLNPNGLVPTLEDGDMALWESNTIMRYLARTHDRNHHFPTDIKSQYHSEKWMDWQLSVMWPQLRAAFLGLTRVPEMERNYDIIRKNYQDSNLKFEALDQVLSGQKYCSGNQFHLGDIVLALCVHRWILLNKTFPEKTGPRTQLIHIDNWMQRVTEETRFNEIADTELNIIVR